MRYDFRSRDIRLHGVDTNFDYFEINNVTYQAIPLDSTDSEKGHGINSSVFQAIQEDGDNSETTILKVCNYAEENTMPKIVARRKRFLREIEAMQLALEKGKQNLVVVLKGDGEIIAKSDRGERIFKCFLMETASSNLKEYLDAEIDISLQQRLVLCAALVRSVHALHDIGIYHRDIKPENIFLCDGGWKIGDLGLAIFRHDDSEAESREKIGPPKWMSPEAFNKAYCISRPANNFIDRSIDERSDVYQLGKVCWHIIQGDIPNGCLKSKDLVEGGGHLFGSFLKPMLRYQRIERPLLSELEERLVPLIQAHSI
jgi:serine/threonine protein kinase